MCYCVKEIEINPLMLFLSVQKPGKNEPLGGRQIFSEDRGLSRVGGYLQCLPLPGSPAAPRGRPRVCAKSKDLGEPARKILPDNLYLADFSFGLCNFASVGHVKSTRMVCCRLISVDL